MTDESPQLSEDVELELRGRITVLEQRLAQVFWIAAAAELGVLVVATLLALELRSRGGG